MPGTNIIINYKAISHVNTMANIGVWNIPLKTLISFFILLLSNSLNNYENMKKL